MLGDFTLSCIKDFVVSNLVLDRIHWDLCSAKNFQQKIKNSIKP